MGADATPDRHLDHLFDLSSLVLDPDTAFTERLTRALERERQYLDLPHGMLTSIDREAERETVVLTTDTDAVLEEGETVPLSEMYCRETVASDAGRLAITAASEEGWAEDPAYQRFGLETYVGSVIEFDGDRRGTVCFTGEEPRTEEFDEEAIDLVALLARWASYELARTIGHSPVDAADRRFASFVEPLDPEAIDTALALLAHPVRRELLAYLSRVEGPVTVSDVADHLAASGGVPGEPPERVEIALVHSHLPKLSRAGVVSYDDENRELDYRTDDAVERILGRVRSLEA